MGSALSVVCMLAVSYAVSQVVQGYMWRNQYGDGRKKAPWPPSVSKLPTFWNAYERFNSRSSEFLTAIGQELGNVFSIKLIQRRVIVLNHAAAVRAALVDHQQENSSRRKGTQLDGVEYVMTEQGKTVFTAPFSTYWGRLRRAILRVLGSKSSIEGFELAFRNLADRACELSAVMQGEALREHVNLLAMEATITLVMGEQPQQHVRVEQLRTLITACEQAQSLQTTKWYYRYGTFLPLARAAGFIAGHSDAIRIRDQALEVLLTLDRSDRSIVHSLHNLEPSVHDPEPQPLEPEEVVINQLHLIMHGYQHLGSALFTAIQRLATLDQSFQDRLYNEGPTLMNAFVAESLRFNPPMRLFSHTARTDHDVEFVKGKVYRVDEDTDLVVNLHNIHFDPHIYPEPHHFDPERFFHMDEQRPSILECGDKQNAAAQARDHLTFGVGRRACLGSRAAQRIMTTILMGLVRRYRLKGGDVDTTIDYPSAVWSWTGRSETKGSAVHLTPR